MDTLILKEACRQKRLNKKKKYDFSQPLSDFIRCCYAYKAPQSYGSAIEKRYITNLSLQKVAAKQKAGDLVENGKNKELKSSISDCNEFNVVQIRPHHKIDSYVLSFFNIDEEGNVSENLFDVPSEVMYKLDLGGAHGTKDEEHDLKEYRITIKVGDKNWQKILPYRVEGKKW